MRKKMRHKMRQCKLRHKMRQCKMRQCKILNNNETQNLEYEKIENGNIIDMVQIVRKFRENLLKRDKI